MVSPHQKKWLDYRDSRRGNYAFRARTRYSAVAKRLSEMGIRNGHTVVDVGAGSLQFGRYLREERGWTGLYAPVDAVLDGTDLETWQPGAADFYVCIEVLEHLRTPFRLMEAMSKAARRGVVITTPNSKAVDVLGCDPTHVSVVHALELWQSGYTVARHSWFGTPDDTLLAHREVVTCDLTGTI